MNPADELENGRLANENLKMLDQQVEEEDRRFEACSRHQGVRLGTRGAGGYSGATSSKAPSESGASLASKDGAGSASASVQPTRKQKKEAAEYQRSRSNSPAPGKAVCTDFQKGNCTYGDSCRFSHDAPAAPAAAKAEAKAKGKAKAKAKAQGQ